jgi:hypothetical protein
MALRHRLGVAIGVALLGAGFAACSTSNGAAPAAVKCTPGAYVFCRCEDRSEGTKLCRPDGTSFDACKCDGTQPPITEDPDGGLGSTPLEPVDAGPVTGPTIDAKCVGKLGLVAGSAADNATFVASYMGAGAFNTSKSASSPAVRGPVTIVPSGTSLVATYLARMGYLAWTKLTGSTWSAPESLGDGFADTTHATSMTLLAGQPRIFYLGQDAHFHMGTYGANGWDIAFTAGPRAEPPGDAGASVPGKSAPAATTVGSSITLAFAGNDGTLARDTYSSGSWSNITRFTDTSTWPAAYGTAAAIAALDPGGTRDELIVYPGKDLLLHVATRDAGGNHSWNTPILFDTAASSSEIALQALPGGKALLVYRASNGQGYYAVWAASTGFGPPAELVPGKNPELASVPSITRGQCGSDATLAYAQKDGRVKILRYGGGTMTGPFDVGGITKATFVGVGELP